MTRPVADILAEAERDNWPTSYIGALANHHLCGNGDLTGHAATREGRADGARQDATPCGPAGVASTSPAEGTPMAKPTPEELAQLRDAIAHKARNGEDTGVLDRIHDIGAEQAEASD